MTYKFEINKRLIGLKEYTKSNRTNRYKELCDKYGAKDAKFTVGKLKGEFSNRQELQVGDKGSLCYHNCIGFNFPADCMTKVYIEKLVKSIKY